MCSVDAPEARAPRPPVGVEHDPVGRSDQPPVAQANRDLLVPGSVATQAARRPRPASTARVPRIERRGPRPDDLRGAVGVEQVGVVVEAEVLAHQIETQAPGEAAGAVAQPGGIGLGTTVALLVEDRGDQLGVMGPP